MSVSTRLGWLFAALILVFGAGWLAGCGGDDGDGSGKPLTLTGTCSGCHEDAEMLQATAVPEETPEEGDSGEG
jgi:hypothetical protein